MPTLANQVLGLLTVASVASDAAAPTYRNSRGFDTGTAIVRNGAGDYTLTTKDAYDSTRIVASLCVVGGALHGGSLQFASATTLRTRTYTVTAVPSVAAADLDFSISTQEISPN